MPFLSEFTREIVQCLPNTYAEDNYDPNRFGPLSRKKKIAGVAIKALSKLGFIRLSMSGVREFFQIAEPLFEGLEQLHEELEDADSKALLVKVMAYRALGFRKVKLPLNTPGYWAQLEEMKARCSARDTIEVPLFDFALQRVNLQEVGFPLEMYATPLGALAVFVTLQYEHAGNGTRIKVAPGDVVIDAGGCWGDTALYFGHRARPEGRVFVYEFIPSNLEILRRNLDLNPDTRDSVNIVDSAVWDESGLHLCFKDRGPASQVFPDDGRAHDGTTTTLTIDDLVSREGLSSVDFIKMDIEGAEPHALRGAEQTIRKHKPKLAISVYHRLSDFVDVHQLIRSFSPGYRFYLGHSTIYGEETVLFAVHD